MEPEKALPTISGASARINPTVRHTDIELIYHIMRQYALRIIFYEPTLFMKSLEKVSLKDLILSEDFTIEDARLFGELFIRQRLALGLLWLKDSVLEALSIVTQSNSSGIAANFGDLGEPVASVVRLIF